MLFFGKFYVTKKSKNVEIVLGISKAKSGSIAIKIRQPFLWTDSYLHCLTQILFKRPYLEEEKVSDRTQYQRLFAEDMAIPNNKCQKDIARAIGKQETDFVHPPTRLKVIFCLKTKIIPKRVNVYIEL